MNPLVLVIGNKNYSSWSLRPWLYLKYHGIDFQEILIPLYIQGSRERILAHSPAGKVPALIHGKTTVWDSLAILEYLAEHFPQTQGWPASVTARAFARSICAEMHSGFQTLRQQLTMNVRKQFKARAWAPEVWQDIARIQDIWKECRGKHGRSGPFLFGRFSIADAMYAPVIWRFHNYAVKLEPLAEAYCKIMLELPAMGEWQAAALVEKETLPQFEMPYEAA